VTTCVGQVTTAEGGPVWTGIPAVNESTFARGMNELVRQLSHVLIEKYKSLSPPMIRRLIAYRAAYLARDLIAW